MFYYYMRGFAVAVLTFFAFILSFIFARIMYPHIANFLRNTGTLFETLQNWVSRSLDLSGIAEQAGAALNLDKLLSELNLPQFVQTQLINANTAETRSQLNLTLAAPIEEFLAAFIAGAIINIISMVIAFLVAFIALKVIISMVDLVTRLPIIKQVNKLFGAALGALIGVFVSWAVLTVMVWIFSNNPNFNVTELLENSLLAGAFQRVNIISQMTANM
jgi:uncharacterized membrane protein required for colicin V production